MLPGSLAGARLKRAPVLSPDDDDNDDDNGDGGDGAQSNLVVATVCQSSTLVGLVVGASFVFSQVSPIAIFDTGAALTRMHVSTVRP